MPIESKTTIRWEDFQSIDLRAGTIVHAEVFKEARNPSYKLVIDLGELGTKKSSAQITELYEPSELIGKQVLCVCNLPPKQIGPIQSEVLVTGFHNTDGQVSLASVDHRVPDGACLS